VLSWGGNAVVVKPAELKEMVRKSAEKLLKNQD
jgi:predicted DNA-binding transcriptional regulator YafY